MWKGSTVNAFTITIPPGVKVLKITTENTYVNEFVDPNLPRYIGVTGGKTYRITVDYGSEIDGTDGMAFIRYSQRINAVKPNLTDY